MTSINVVPVVYRYASCRVDPIISLLLYSMRLNYLWILRWHTCSSMSVTHTRRCSKKQIVYLRFHKYMPTWSLQWSYLPASKKHPFSVLYHVRYLISHLIHIIVFLSLFKYGLNSEHFPPPVSTTRVDICHLWECSVIPFIIVFVSLPRITTLEYRFISSL